LDKVLRLNSGSSSRAIAFAGAVSGGAFGVVKYDWQNRAEAIMGQFRDRSLDGQSLRDIQERFLQDADTIQKEGSTVGYCAVYIFEARADRTSVIGEFGIGDNDGENNVSFGISEFKPTEIARLPKPLGNIEAFYQCCEKDSSIASVLKFIHTDPRPTFGELQTDRAIEAIKHILMSMEEHSPFGISCIGGQQIILLAFPKSNTAV
jgi:hypothetical protein